MDTDQARAQKIDDLASQCSEMDIVALQNVNVLHLAYIDVCIMDGVNVKSYVKQRFRSFGFKYFASSPAVSHGDCPGLVICSKYPIIPAAEDMTQSYIDLTQQLCDGYYQNYGALIVCVKPNAALPPLTIVNTCFGYAARLEAKCQALMTIKDHLQRMQVDNYVIAGHLCVCSREVSGALARLLKASATRRSLTKEWLTDFSDEFEPSDMAYGESRPSTNAVRNASEDYVIQGYPAVQGPRWEYCNRSSKLFKPIAMSRSYDIPLHSDNIFRSSSKGTLSESFGICGLVAYKQTF